MSTAIPTDESAELNAKGVRTYRGRSLEELLPRIREELGAEAIVLRQREGLIGGVGGFFAQRCIEVDARAGAQRVDLYDEDDAADPLSVLANDVDRRQPASPEDEFGLRLREASAAWSEGPGEPAASLPAPVAAPAPALLPAPLEPTLLTPVLRPIKLDADEPAPLLATPPSPPPSAAEPVNRTRALSAKLSRRSKTAASAPAARTGQHEEAAAIARELADRGAAPEFIARLLGDAAAHHAPLACQGSLRDAVRGVIARGLVPPAPLPVTGAAVVFAGSGGSGKTRCAAALSSAYARRSVLAPTVLTLCAADRGRELAGLLKGDEVAVKAPQSPSAAFKAVIRARAEGIVIIDTPSVSPGDGAAVAALAAELQALEPDAVIVTLPATAGSRSAAELLSGFAPLAPAAIAITHADETDQLGVALELAWTHRIAVAYLHAGTQLPAALSAPEPHELARILLP